MSGDYVDEKNLLVFTLLLLLSACSNTPVVVGETFDGTTNDYDGVTMTIIDDTLSSGGVTVEILNTTEAEIDSGNEHDFRLQIEQDGQWYWLETNRELANTSEAYIYTKDEPRELALTWERTYGNLKPGHYRVTKWFFEYREGGNHPEFLLVSEFTLE